MDDLRFPLILFLMISSTYPARQKPISLFSGNSGSLIVDVTRVEACNNSWNQLKITNFRTNIISRYIRTYDASAYVESPAKKVTNVILSVTRCKDAVSFNTCEHFGTYRFGDGVCEMAKEENAIWTPLMKSITPELRCPISAKTVYTMQNGSVNTELLKALNLPFFNSIWRAEMTAANEERKNVACGNFDVKITGSLRPKHN